MSDAESAEPTAAAGTGPLLALAGAAGFLTRLPVGAETAAWDAFRTRPWTFVPVGYLVGTLVALPVAGALLAGLPAPTVAVVLPVAVVVVTGINHADGLADLGDAAVVHGGPADRRAVMTDSQLGVGGTAALALSVAALALAGLGLASLPVAVAVAVVVASEVGAKLGMVVLACLGRAPADSSLGAALTRATGPTALWRPSVLALPAAVLAWPGAASVLALAAGVGTALLVRGWARTTLGGTSGDVFGAANELARVVALHVGVVVWTLS